MADVARSGPRRPRVRPRPDFDPPSDIEGDRDGIRSARHGWHHPPLRRRRRVRGTAGPEPWGQRFVGLGAIREAFAARLSGIPDVRYQQDDHLVDGDRGASEWTLSGTTTEGERIEVRGCDLWTLRDGKVVKKDSYWKIRPTG